MLGARKAHERNKKNNIITIFLNSLIVFMAFFNVFIFFLNRKYYFNLSQNSQGYIKTFRRKFVSKENSNVKSNPIADEYRSAFTDTFTPAELQEAIKGLHLPTWSRRYVNCNSPKSEVTCPQIVHAWRILNGWAESQKEGFSKHDHFIMQHLYDGVGNRMSTDMATFVIALMDNRTYTVEAKHPSRDPRNSFGQAFDFHPAVTYRHGNNSEVNQYYDKHISSAYNIQTFDYWYRYDYPTVFKNHKLIYVNYLLFATMPYIHHQLGQFCIEHFGIHAAYFICNFLMYIPDIAMNQATKVVESVPKNVRLFGVHLRFQEPGHFFSYNVSTTIKSVEGFLKDRHNAKPTIFALATDSAQMEKDFKTLFPDTISTNALRIPDADHLTALYDIALLEYCEDLLLTYRSTFSCIVMARTAKNAYFVEKESPGVFDISNSQASMISMIYHQFDVNDWQTCRRFFLTENGEETFRHYFSHFLL